MKHLIRLAFLFFLCCGCLSMDIGSQTDKKADFSLFKTYAWVHRTKQYKHADAKVDNDIVENRITSNVNKEMVDRGFTVDTQNPDILLDYDILTEQKSDFVEQQGYTGNFYYSQPYIGVYSPFNSWSPQSIAYGSAKTSYENGTVIIYVADKTKNHLIWKAWADGTVEDIRAFEDELPKDIHSMFTHFPLKAQKKRK